LQTPHLRCHLRLLSVVNLPLLVLNS
jgi:hypothetical protein